MKKYLGSYMSVFGAIVMPVFFCSPLLLGVLVLCSETSGASVVLMFGGIVSTLIIGHDIKVNWTQLYSWGHFTSDGVQIMTWFSKRTTMLYEKCKSCGIGFYVHGTLNSKAGSTIYFIFLSYDLFDESFRWNMNLWKSSQTRIKVQFNKKLYDYLLTVLPKDLSQMLRRDYEMLFGQNKKSLAKFSPKKR